ncbi:tautomerase family protein [Flavobacterium hercynium]|uniref:4-oxalocrotonate tautomerase n=1 Tax=Flavobacterium hercynium TaxID=387094 RepID=A0A226GSK2_9FLAO|nr:4-oxalocrotonate tautomerase [Flavobacterium hercynium]OXA84895.1 4-oxalocrotonate tautomerase [Flavobacterium hercynium]SMP22199.1 4-oxalocrotonate tautomerase [Flavobacterium hercynium]
MPAIHLKISGKENPALAKELVQTISNLTKDILNKKPEVTVVTVSFIPDYLWFINSQSLAELGKNSFNLTIKISDSTNLKEDKARFIEALHTTLAAKLDNLHPVSYTAIEEMKADAYGYDGLTIEYKIIQNKILKA